MYTYKWLFLILVFSLNTFANNNNCVCEAKNEPVCGIDNKIYKNKCKAKCKNIAIAHKGLCEEKKEYYMNVVLKHDEYHKDNRAIESLNEKEIVKANTGFVGDLFKNVNGVHVQETGSGQVSPFLRGITGQHTLIMFDGVRVNNSIFRYGPNQYMAIFDPFMLRKIEVLKGNSSTLYGSDAIGGVISMDSKKILGNHASGDMIYIDSSRTGAFHLDFTTKFHFLDNFTASLLLGASMNDSKNLKTADDLVQKYTSYRYYSGTGKLNLDFNKMGSLTLFGTYFSQLDGYRTDKSKIKDYRQYPQQNHGIYYLKYKNYFPKTKSVVEATAYYQTTYEEYKRYKLKSTSYKLSDHRIDDIKQYGFNLRIRNDILDIIKLYTTMEYVIDQIESNKNYFDNSDYHMFSLGEKADYRFKNILFGAGARLSFVKLEEVQNVEYSKANISFSAFAQYFVNDNYNLALNFSQGFRAPNLNDLTGSIEFHGGYEFGDANLSAEKAYMIELTNKFQGKYFKASSSFYINFLKDFIGRKVIDKPAGYESYDMVVKKTNLNSGYIAGGELSFWYNFNKMINIKTAISYNYGVLDEVVDKKTLRTEKHPMRRIPPFVASLGIDYNLNKNINFFYDATYSAKQNRLSDGDKKDKRIPEGGTPAFFVNSLGTNISTDNFNLRLILHNLFDKKYKYHGSGFYQSGRTFMIKFHTNL